MDSPDIDPELHRHALIGLARLNRFSGVAGRMFRELRLIHQRLGGKPLRVLDIASGSGDLPINWALRAKQAGLPWKFAALDISPTAVDSINERANSASVELETYCGNVLTDPLPTEFDVVTNSLTLHHFDDDDVATFARSMVASARHHVLVCDLQRSRLNSFLVQLGARLLTRSPVVHVDAKLSIHGAYRSNEVLDLFELAIGTRPNATNCFPARFILNVTTDGSGDLP